MPEIDRQSCRGRLVGDGHTVTTGLQLYPCVGVTTAVSITEVLSLSGRYLLAWPVVAA